MLLIASLAVGNPASAQKAAPASSPDNLPDDMSMTDLQSLSCLGGGLFGSGVLYYWSDVLTAPVTGPIPPLLLAPTLAAGFIGGCSLLSNIAPGLFWIYRHL
jgi:hypothetical protein